MSGPTLGRYELLGELGVGGMARVCLARAVGEGGFERLVAIKVLHDHLAREQEFVAMFLDEARLAARIRHPNVVSTIDIQSSEGTRYLVMDYVEGASLSALLQGLAAKRALLPVGVALRIQLDVLAGLHAAHELTDAAGQPVGLVHRDVSPHNVLVGKDGVARITDFGVARAETRLSSTRSGEIKGKVPYMAPEQILSEPVDRRADVYAAALVLWEMLAGRRLVAADNHGALLRKIVEGAHAPAREHNPDVPDAIEAVCKQAMSKLAVDRFATAAEFGEALEEAARAAGVRVAPARAVGALTAEHAPASVAKPLAQPSSVGAAARGVGPVGVPREVAAAPPAPTDGVSSSSSTAVATVSALAPRPDPPKRSAARWVVAAAGVVGVAAAALAFSRSGSQAPRSSSTGSTEAKDVAAPTATTMPSPDAEPRTSASPPPQLTGSASATAAPATSAPAAAPQGPRRDRKKPGSAADFLPGEL